MFSKIIDVLVESSNRLTSEPIVVGALILFTIWAGIHDIKTLKIKNQFNLIFILFGIALMVLGFVGHKVNLPEIVPTLAFGWTNIWGMIGGFLFIFIPAFIKNHPMGGDIKISAVIGFWIGFTPVVFVLLIATIFNILYWLGALYVYKDYGSKTLMPFAPFIALGVMVFYGLGYFL
ncbi:prepilin peptidase [Rossellomorea marisflavi]|uniref:prepilin peptidase n=1 Tax=Rossellomorea marisflavi TaxID=189381 RepID=UPI003FA0B439